MSPCRKPESSSSGVACSLSIFGYWTSVKKAQGERDEKFYFHFRFGWCWFALKINSAYTFTACKNESGKRLFFCSLGTFQQLVESSEKCVCSKRTEMKSQITLTFVRKSHRKLFCLLFTHLRGFEGSRINFFNLRHVTSRLGVAVLENETREISILTASSDVCQLFPPASDSIFDFN